MNEELSPEERLLNLIRGETKTSSDPEEHNPPPLTPGKEQLAIPKAKKAISEILEKKKSRAILWKQRLIIKKPGFKFVHKTLLAFCLLLLVYLTFDYIMDSKPPEILSAPKVVRSQEIKEGPPLTLRPYSYYSAGIGKRDIFKSYRETKPEFLIAPELKRVTLRERAANLTLTGIVLDKEPQAVIVDKQERKTYFLNKGQFLREIKIEEILKGKVILSYEEERLDLRL